MVLSCHFSLHTENDSAIISSVVESQEGIQREEFRMTQTPFPVIDLHATGENILRLRKEAGYSVRELQQYLGFEQPQAIYKWQSGASLPSLDNLLALSELFQISINDILVKQDQVLFLPVFPYSRAV